MRGMEVLGFGDGTGVWGLCNLARYSGIDGLLSYARMLLRLSEGEMGVVNMCKCVPCK